MGVCDEWGGAESRGSRARPVELMIMSDTCATHRSRVPRRSSGRIKGGVTTVEDERGPGLDFECSPVPASFFPFYELCYKYIYILSNNEPYLWVAKVCESLGLAVNLKVKLESICAEVFSVSAMTIKCQYVTCFIQRTGIYQSLIMFVEVKHVMNKGDYWGPRKKSWCCSSG